MSSPVTRTLRPEKTRTNNCQNPWRLVDSLTGKEVSFPEVFDHPDLGPTGISSAGFPTKAAAIEAMGRMAASTLPEPETADE